MLVRRSGLQSPVVSDERRQLGANREGACQMNRVEAAHRRRGYKGCMLPDCGRRRDEVHARKQQPGRQHELFVPPPARSNELDLGQFACESRDPHPLGKPAFQRVALWLLYDELDQRAEASR